MNDEVIYCPAQTYARTMVSPEEFCTNEVESYGDLCPEHDIDDRSDEAYENYLESKWTK